MTIRIGFGYDIHRLEPGRPLRLGCVEIPHDRGLVGHSDGDAAAHALADALLAAGGMDEIGALFPSGDPRWKDAPGERLLDEVRRRLDEAQFDVQQADVTILAEEPRIAPHKGRIISALSSVLGCDPSLVTVKARTQEGLGAIGRGEAIAAYALVLVRQRNA